jgi:AcrR family transcriptional regulator
MTSTGTAGKGDRTREAILARGVDVACRVGLGGLTIGDLAAGTGLSKSGLYAHFGWLGCGRLRLPGGCLFVKASTELDEQPGPVRDRLAERHRELVRTIARVFAGGITEGQFRPEADPDQFATDLYGVMLVYYHAHRLLADPRAEERARVAVAALLDAARPGAARPIAPRPVAPRHDAPAGADR